MALKGSCHENIAVLGQIEGCLSHYIEPKPKQKNSLDEL